MKKQKTESVKAAGVILMTETSPAKFLLMRHKDRWDLPKGHCDGEETYLETAHREMEEETGILASECRFAPDFQFDIEYEVTYRKHPGKIFKKKIRYFLAWIPDVVRIDLTEHVGFEWMTWAPPHDIQTQTINPLLAAVQKHLSREY